MSPESVTLLLLMVILIWLCWLTIRSIQAKEQANDIHRLAAQGNSRGQEAQDRCWKLHNELNELREFLGIKKTMKLSTLVYVDKEQTNTGVGQAPAVSSSTSDHTG